MKKQNKNINSSSPISPRPVWERVPAGQVRGCPTINSFTVPSSGCADCVLQPTSPRGRSYNNAFTLIELLVVVLIIGILAAIALPQHQKAVEKTRASTIFPIARSLLETQRMYYLANGSYATTFDELDMTPPGALYLKIKESSGERIFSVILTDQIWNLVVIPILVLVVLP